MVGVRFKVDLANLRRYLRASVNSVDAALDGKRRVQFEITNDVTDHKTGRRYYLDVDEGRGEVRPKEERFSPGNPEPRLWFQAERGRWVSRKSVGPSRPARITDRGRQIIRENFDAYSRQMNGRLAAARRLPTGADFVRAIEDMKVLIVESMQQATDESVKHQDTKDWYGHDVPSLRESFKVTTK